LTVNTKVLQTVGSNLTVDTV